MSKLPTSDRLGNGVSISGLPGTDRTCGRACGEVIAPFGGNSLKRRQGKGGTSSRCTFGETIGHIDFIVSDPRLFQDAQYARSEQVVLWRLEFGGLTL